MSPDLAETVKRLRELAARATHVETRMQMTPLNIHAFGELANAALDALEGLERERDEARKLIYVPGQWRCAKCKFVCQRMILNAFSGAVGVQADTKTEPCPNGCGPLWPVTERQAGNDLCDRLEAAFENEKLLKARITSLESSLAEARKGARTDDGLGVWRCFHCAEVFTDYAAAEEHFGHSLNETAACKLSDTEHGLISLYRDARKQLDEYHNEDNEAYREFYRLGAAHTTALREAEQKGYDTGLADGRAQHPTAPQETGS